MCCCPVLLEFWLYVMKTDLFTYPKPAKPMKPTSYRLWRFMLDMLELDGGLKAQSLSKVVFSEMRNSQMGETNLFTHPKPTKPIKPTFQRLSVSSPPSISNASSVNPQSLPKKCFIGFFGLGCVNKLVFPICESRISENTTLERL